MVSGNKEKQYGPSLFWVELKDVFNIDRVLKHFFTNYISLPTLTKLMQYPYNPTVLETDSYFLLWYLPVSIKFVTIVQVGDTC